MNAILAAALEAAKAELTREITVPEAPFEFGSDLSCVTDIDELGTELAHNDPRCVWEYLLRRWTTKPDTLRDEPGWGIDAREWVNKGVTERELTGYADQLRVEGEDDDRIQSIEIEPTWIPQTSKLSFAVRVVSADPTIASFSGTFALTQAGTVESTFDGAGYAPLPSVSVPYA